MSAHTTPYGISTTVPLACASAVERTKEALATEGFAVLDPVEALRLSGNDAIQPIAEDVRRRLDRVLAAVERMAD